VEQVWAKALDEVPAGLSFGSSVREMQPVHPGSADPKACTDTSGRPGPWHERLPHFRLDHTPSFGEELQSEYLIPREHAPQAIRSLRKIGSRIAPLLLVSEIRTVARDSLWMSPAYDRDSVAIHFTWKPLLPEVKAFLPELESVLAPFHPRPHWGKLFEMSVADAYPRIDDFRSLCLRLDPEGRLENAFLRRFL
jgi:xylitol oxidase